MKKRIVIMLCFIMMASLVACSKPASKKKDQGEQVLNEESLEGQEVEKREEEFVRGKIENFVYENEFIGIGCALDSNWYFYNEEEIMKLSNYTTDVAGEDYEELMKGINLIYDMLATSNDQLENMNVSLEKMSKLLLDNLVVEDTLEQTIPIVKNTFTNMGYTDLQAELDTVRIEGKEMSCLFVTGKINGINMYQKTIPIKCTGYLATIAITSMGENTVDSIAERFYFVK